jgi:hypothetical protein
MEVLKPQRISPATHICFHFLCIYTSPTTSMPSAFSYPLIEIDVRAWMDHDEFIHTAQGGLGEMRERVKGVMVDPLNDSSMLNCQWEDV